MTHARLPAALAVAALVLAGGGAALEPLTLTIRNGAGEDLRCEAVLAHFMSETLARIAPGRSLVVTLRRDSGGVLLLAPREGRHVPLENILCGSETAWAASKSDLPLTTVRAGSGSHYQVRCALADSRVACRVAEE